MKKIKYIISIIIFLILLSTNVQAASSLQAKLEGTTTEVKEGQQITISFRLNNYQDINKGINAYKATLEYDKNVFEEVVQSDFQEQNNWEELKYNKDTGEFVSIKKAGSREEEEVAKITLKVKKDATVGKTSINIKDTVTSEGKEDINVAKNGEVVANLTINVIEEQQTTPTEPTNPENPSKPSNPDDLNNNQSSSGDTENLGENDNVATGKLPKTGTGYGKWFILIAIEVLIVIAYISRKKVKKIDEKIKNKKTKMFMTILVVGIISMQLVGTIYAAVSNFTSKGELNDDGEINYLDVNLLELHLVHLKTLPDEKLENADMNSDGQITVTDLTLLIQKLEKTLDYEVTISDAGQQTYYPNKNDEISLRFIGDVTYGAKIKEVVINNTKYEVNKIDDINSYEVNLGVVTDAGIKEYHFTEAILDNGKTIKTNQTIKLDVLKDKPTIEHFNYVEDDNNKMKATFTIIDNEQTITSGNITVTDENGNQIATQDVKSGENEITFTKGTCEVYEIKVLVNYDLDTNAIETGKNEYKNQVLLEEEMNVSDRMIEMKDIENVSLYKQDGNNVIKVTEVNMSDLSSLEKYLVKVEMKDLPSFYSKIAEYKAEDNVLKFVLDYDKAVQYDGEQKHNYIEVEYGPITGDVANQSDISLLIEQITNNPYGNYELVSDLDASQITEGTAVILETFCGTLNGNGHSIKNLSRPLFSSLNGATIENLVIKDADVTANGVFTINMTATTIRNVHFNNITLTSINTNGTGILAGVVYANSLIEECTATDVTVGNAKITGGFIGKMTNSIIRNSYISRGTVSSNSDGTGGFIGETLTGCTVENCYVNVHTSFSGSGGSRGGLIGNPVNTILNNNLSIATSASGDGRGSRMFGKYQYNISGSSKNNYELATSNLTSNASNSAVNEVDEATLKTKKFYTGTLQWDEEIWNFDNVENGGYPTLKNSDPNNEVKETPSNEDLYIPDYSRLKKLSNYDETKEIAYHNLYKLIPFYDAKYLLVDGSKIDKTDILNTNKIEYIVPLDSNNQFIVGLETSKPNKIAKIRVVFDNDTTQDYTVTYKNTINNLIANYKITDLNIEYQYNGYLANINTSLKQELINLANSYDYETQIAELTSETESRLYVDYYNETVKPKMEEVITKYIMTYMSYSNTDSTILRNKIENDLKNEEQLQKYLYTYNFYDKWYCIDLDGIVVSDLLLFFGDKMYDGLDIDYLTSTLLTSSYRATSTSYQFFEMTFRGKVGGLTLPNFLEYLFKVLNGYDDPSDWMVDHFKGILYEQPAIGVYSDQIEYRIWPMMTVKTYAILPILSAPQEDMYMISCPSQFIIGSMNRYSTYLTKDGEERTRMKEAIESYANYLGIFYGTSAGFVPDSVTRINNIVNMQFDTRFNFPASDKADAGTQAAGTTRDPVMKWVYEAIGRWAAANGSGAYANGTDVWWVSDSALGNVSRSLNVFTHETAHNQDNRYFYSGAGRRSGTGAEAHADGVFAQSIGAETFTFNLIRNYELTDDVTTNLTYGRVDTAEKIHSYYQEMYETKYVLEYLEAQAFLRLTPEEQAKVAVQAQHPTGTGYETTYVRLTTEDFEAMNLETVEDLWDNQIAIRGTGTSPTAGAGNYYAETFYNVYFYIPANPDGVGDSHTFKRLGYEMLGYAGYNDGFINYMSGRTANDLAALRKITGDDTITWKEYKMSRYENVENNLKNISYYDIEELLNLYERALKTDASNNNLNTSIAVTKLYYGIMKRATNDFTTGGIYNNPEVISITSAEQFVELLSKNEVGNYRIDADLDFSNIEPVEGQNYYIENRFVGTLDGNGHKLTGVKYTLFNSIIYADIKNVVIEKPDYESDVNAYLAVNSKNVLIHDITVNEANRNVTNITTKNNLIFTLGENTLTMRDYEINSIEDFLGINESDETRARQYNLTTDLDFSDYIASNGVVITGTFTGVIKGNGHTISNLNNATLFANFNGTVDNLNIENFKNTRNVDTVTAFANNTNNATLKNMNFENIILKGTHRTAVVAAVDNSNSTFEQISVKNANVTGSGVYVSTFIGRKYGGAIKNCYVEGTLECYTTECGGLIGALQNGGQVSNVVVNVDINRPRSTDSRNNNGGFIGNIYNSPTITNSISIGNMTGFINNGSEINVSKFVGCTEEIIIATLQNCYEFEDTTGTTSATENTEGHLDVVTRANIHDKNFYKNILGFDENIWNLDTVTTKGYPELK